MKRVLACTVLFLTGSLSMFSVCWATRYMEKHPYRPHFQDTNEIELIFLFQQRYTDWMEHIQKGENASSQWSELRRMGEILEEIKHRKVGDMEQSDALYDAEQKKAKEWLQSRNSGI